MEKKQRKNCWEVKNCGQHPGSAKADELGVCPAAIETKANGINGGINGGRACWAIAGTFCDGKIQGTYAQKLIDCIECDFYRFVMRDEGALYQDSKKIREKLKEQIVESD